MADPNEIIYEIAKGKRKIGNILDILHIFLLSNSR